MRGVKYALVSVLALSTFTVTAQFPNVCAYEDDDSSVSSFDVYSRSTDPNYLAQFDPVVFNIFFWEVLPETESPGPVPLTEAHCLESVSQLNRVYNEFGIFFKYIGFDNTSFKSDTYYHLSKQDLEFFFLDAASAGHKRNDSFNIYIASGGSEFSGAAQLRKKVNIATHYNFFKAQDTMAHEVGHCFDLHHTHKYWDQGGSPEGCELGVEHVTRNEFLPNGNPNPDWNADIAGDEVIDTAAMPDFRNEWCHYQDIDIEDCASQGNPVYVFVDENTFEYTGDGGDCLDPPRDYQLESIDVKNYMAYVPNAPNNELFFFNFTAGQKIRMHEAIGHDWLGDFADASTTIETLYEPYKGVYSGNGSIVGPQVLPTFQPGFDYEFVSCGPYGAYPPPLDYDDLSFWYVTGGLYNYTFNKNILPQDYDLIVHKNNFAISIAQLNNPPRNCYSATGAASSGLVVKFEDEVFNNNITVTPKDSTGINSPALIHDLPQGLYKIEKNHTDGAVEETVIYKQND